jgi:class 3 adenylate cyclase/TolB-like protein
MDEEMSTDYSKSRHLAAIMFTDLVGYSAFMGRNEEKAIEVVRKNRDLHQTAIKNHGGKLLKEMGDGMLAIFPSALESVKCALEIQNHTKKQNLKLPVRIGLHLGDINVENEDIFGDGVNVASRIQSIADPGGIYISESIYRAISSHSDLKTKYLGEIRLKNISEPVRTYALQTEGLPTPTTKRLASVIKKHSDLKVYRNMAIIALLIVVILVVWFTQTYKIERIIKPLSVAVLPFKDLTNDPERDYLSNGMTDALIKELSKASQLTVISQQSTILYAGTIKPTSQIAKELNNTDYIVKGAIKSFNNMVETEIQLIDPENDQIIWQQAYSEDISNSIQMWSVVAQDLIKQLGIEVSSEDAILWKDIRKVNPETYELYLKGMHYLNKTGSEDQLQGMAYLNEAVD